jgi:hypothetical protein
VRTWDPVGWGGTPAFVPENVGNPNLGPEVTGEFEVGFDGSWANDRINAVFTYFNQRTTDALMEVSQVPSSGFTGSQLENVGEIKNTGIELGLNLGLIQTANYGWDLGVNLSTNNSEVIDLGGAAPFSALNGWIEEGYPVPVERGDRVTNPTEVADPVYETDAIIGPQIPTRQIALNTQVRVPGGIVFAANGEYRGGHVVSTNPISISRSVRSPLCRPFYQNPETAVDLVPETPALWRARCTPSEGEDYWYDGAYFKLRTVSATIPVNFAFPDRVNNASLTLSLNNSFLWMKEVPWMDPEILGNDGANEPGLGASERTPAPVTFLIALRVTF